MGMIRPACGVLIGLGLGVLFERWRFQRQQGDNKRDCKKSIERAAISSSSNVVNAGKVIHVDRGELERAIAACLKKASIEGAEKCASDKNDQATAILSNEHAKLVAHVLVAADCRGIPSHGVNRADVYCAELRTGLVNGGALPGTTQETESIANVNGHNSMGAIVASFAMNLCIQKCKSNHGISMVVCHNSNHYGIAGYWAELALKQGLIGFSFTNTSPFMIPTRSNVRAGGTNPIAFYCPAAKDNDCVKDSFQLDMATTTVPVGKVEVCHRKGDKVPLGWGLGADGTQSTTDPTEVILHGGLTPLGGLEETAGYKGYGLNMMVEILCGVLSGCKDIGPDVPPWKIDRGGAFCGYGHCFLCIDPEQFSLGCGQFEQKLSDYLIRMRNLPSAQDGLNVLVPGDPERLEESLAAAEGVRLNESIALGVRELAREFGCEDLLPQEIQQLSESASVAKHLLTT